MAFVVVHHKIENFGKWKPVYDSDIPNFMAKGAKSQMVLRNSADPNELFVILEWDSKENARAYMDSEHVKTKMQQAGVVGMPAIYFLDKA